MEIAQTGASIKTKRYFQKMVAAACNQWWNDLDERERKVIREIPNFDEAIFAELTGISLKREVGRTYTFPFKDRLLEEANFAEKNGYVIKKFIDLDAYENPYCFTVIKKK